MNQLIEKLSPLIAGLFYGGWAAYSNIGHGSINATTAGMIQGGFAFTSTLLLTFCVRSLLAFNKNRKRPRVNTFLQCSLLLFLIPAILHTLAATPEILMAMLPGLIIGNGYVLFLIKNTERGHVLN